MADDIVTRLRREIELVDTCICNWLIEDAADEIERLRAAGDRLKQALLVTANRWGCDHTTDEDKKFHDMVDRAIDGYKEARRG